jgi:hypothetical protein
MAVLIHLLSFCCDIVTCSYNITTRKKINGHFRWVFPSAVDQLKKGGKEGVKQGEDGQAVAGRSMREKEGEV